MDLILKPYLLGYIPPEEPELGDGGANISTFSSDKVKIGMYARYHWKVEPAPGIPGWGVRQWAATI